MGTRWTVLVVGAVLVAGCSPQEPGQFDEPPTGDSVKSTIEVYENLDDSGEQYLVSVGIEGPSSFGSFGPVLRKRSTDGPVVSFTVTSGEYTIGIDAIACTVCELEADEVTNGTLLDVVVNECEARFGVDESPVTIRGESDCTAVITGDAAVPLP